MFSDMDVVFFGGVLKGNVRVKWAGFEEFVVLDTVAGSDRQSLAFCQWLQPGFCQIMLSANALLCGAEGHNLFEWVWATMLHECCHADEDVMLECKECVRDDCHDAFSD